MAAGIQHYMSSILQSPIAYFIGRKLVATWFWQKDSLECTNVFRGEPLTPPPLAMEKGYCCISVTTTTS